MALNDRDRKRAAILAGDREPSPFRQPLRAADGSSYVVTSWGDDGFVVERDRGGGYLKWEDIEPCPNPECGTKDGLILGRAVKGCWITCGNCHMNGPYAGSDGEALRLWNLMPRIRMVCVGPQIEEEEKMREGYKVGVRHALAIAKDVSENGYPESRCGARVVRREIKRQLLD